MYTSPTLPYPNFININTQVFTLKLNTFFTRYIDSGYLKGFLHTSIEMVQKHYPNVPQYRILPYRVYTNKHMLLHSAKYSDKTGIHSHQTQFYVK